MVKVKATRPTPSSLTTVANIIKKFKVPWTVATLPGQGYKRKIGPRLNTRTVPMMEKEPRKTDTS